MEKPEALRRVEGRPHLKVRFKQRLKGESCVCERMLPPCLSNSKEAVVALVG